MPGLSWRLDFATLLAEIIVGEAGSERMSLKMTVWVK
jgi:hypothetical protein